MNEITPTMRDYIRSIFILEEEGRETKTSELARRLGIKPASVTEMIEKLASLGLVSHDRYRGTRMTEKGKNVTNSILRRHRLLERLFVDIVGLDTSSACAEALKLELLLSDRTVDSICVALNHPSECPCGKPIYRNEECCGK
jgi:DtxR family Mn-dependent transcriptional regulator